MDIPSMYTRYVQARQPLRLDPLGRDLTGRPFSTFVRDDGTVYHTLSTTWRGLELLMSHTRSSIVAEADELERKTVAVG